MGRRRSGCISPSVLTCSSSTLSVVLWSVVVLLAVIMSEQPAQHQAASSPTPEEKPAVHIVYMERPPEGEAAEPEAYHLRTLASVLGSEEAAKAALIYSYSTAASGFSAKLTPEQVAKLSKQPGVLMVVPDTIYQLHSGTASVD
ncbi:subtilisin-like protease SBT3.4 isoform X2 [Nymphaea colorata]|nr:subtilisin-like protease SBT3.4 isoform X2 [Nymphaea colorata]